jgi:hypothetical protein
VLAAVLGAGLLILASRRASGAVDQSKT